MSKEHSNSAIFNQMQGSTGAEITENTVAAAHFS